MGLAASSFPSDGRGYSEGWPWTGDRDGDDREAAFRTIREPEGSILLPFPSSEGPGRGLLPGMCPARPPQSPDHECAFVGDESPFNM